MKKFKLFSSLPVLLALFLLAEPLQASAGAAFFNVSNTTTSRTYSASFVHDSPANVSCGGVYTHHMTANLGTVTNTSVRVNNHTVRPVISSGRLAGGMATLHDTENSSNTVTKADIFGIGLTSGRTYTFT